MTIIDKDLLNIVSVLAKESSRLRMNRRQVGRTGGRVPVSRIIGVSNNQ